MRTDEADYEAVCHQQATAYHPTLYLGNVGNLRNLQQADPDFNSRFWLQAMLDMNKNPIGGGYTKWYKQLAPSVHRLRLWPPTDTYPPSEFVPSWAGLVGLLQ